MKLIRSRQASSDATASGLTLTLAVRFVTGVSGQRLQQRPAAAVMNNNLSTPQTLMLLGSRTICNSVFNIASSALRGRFIIRNIKNVTR
jgi:hypothetical protein